MKMLIALVLLTFATGTGAQAPVNAIDQLESMHWITEEYPPFNYSENGQLKGITVDILMAMFAKTGVGLQRGNLHVLPWARGYEAALHKPGTVLFSTTYTIERLQHFKFVGPIIPTRVSLIAAKDRQLEIAAPEDMHTLQIGTVRDDIGDQLIRALGVGEEALERKHSAFHLVQMLARGRLDAIAYAEDIARHQFIRAKMNPDDYETVYVLQKSHMGYAFHRDTDSRVLEPLRKALDELRADGTVDRIYTSYLDGHPDLISKEEKQ